MGADVILIDRVQDAQLGLERERRNDTMFRGRRSLTLDLKSPDGVAAALAIAERADALIEGFRPGVLERLGLGPDVLLARNPRLVIGRMTGWGQDGPMAPRAGHDIDYIALAGVLHAIGRAGEAPVPPLNLVGDFGGGGLLLAFGIACALLEARVSGQGQVVDAAMVEGAGLLTTMLWGMRAAGHWRDERGVNALDTGAPWYDSYATRDGKHYAIGAIEPKFYAEARRGPRPRSGNAPRSARSCALAGTARALRRGLCHPDARRVGRAVRDARRLRGARALVGRGGTASACARAQGAHRSRRRRAAGTRTAPVAHAGPRPRRPARARTRRRRGAARLGFRYGNDRAIAQARGRLARSGLSRADRARVVRVGALQRGGV